MTTERGYTLDDLIHLTGFTRRQIRFYINKKLVPGTEDRGPHAVYSHETLTRLRLIARLKTMQVPPLDRTMTLDEIRGALDSLPPEGIEALLAGTAELRVFDTESGRSMPAAPSGDATGEKAARSRPAAGDEGDEEDEENQDGTGAFFALREVEPAGEEPPEGRPPGEASGVLSGDTPGSKPGGPPGGPPGDPPGDPLAPRLTTRPTDESPDDDPSRYIASIRRDFGLEPGRRQRENHEERHRDRRRQEHERREGDRERYRQETRRRDERDRRRASRHRQPDLFAPQADPQEDDPVGAPAAAALEDVLERLEELLALLAEDPQERRHRTGPRPAPGEPAPWRRLSTPDLEINVRQPDDHRARRRLRAMSRVLSRLLHPEEGET